MPTGSSGEPFASVTLTRAVGSQRRFALRAQGPRARAAAPNQPQPARLRGPTTLPIDLCKHRVARAHPRTIGPRARGGLFSIRACLSAASGEAPRLAPQLAPRRRRLHRTARHPDSMGLQRRGRPSSEPGACLSSTQALPRAWTPTTEAGADRDPLPTGRANGPTFHGSQTPRPNKTGNALTSRPPNRQGGSPGRDGHAAWDRQVVVP